jgi:hypothetical protein
MGFKELQYPTEGEWNSILISNPILQTLDFALKLDVDRFPHELIFFYQGHLEDLLRVFNNRIRQLRFSFVLVTYYFQKGIPDEEWYISPGRKGQSVEYFPHFQKKHHSRKYLFDYFSEAFYSTYFSIFELVVHIVNVIFQLDIDHKNEGLSFRKKVLRSLKTKNKKLHEYICSMQNESVYEKAKDIRNNLIHNLPPNEVTSPVKISKSTNLTKLTIGVGDYIKSSEIMENINMGVSLLKEFLDKFKSHLESE